MGLLDDARPGFLLHEMQGFTPAGTPLGTAWAEIINRTEGICHAPAKELKLQQANAVRRESACLADCTPQKARDVMKICPTLAVSAWVTAKPISELFVEPRGDRPMHLANSGLSRIRRYRATKKGDVSVPVLTTPKLYEAEFKIRGRKAMTAIEKRARRQTRETRQASVEIRASHVTLRPPYRPAEEACSGPSKCGSGSGTKPTRKARNPSNGCLLPRYRSFTPEQIRQIIGTTVFDGGLRFSSRCSNQVAGLRKGDFEDIERLLPCLAIYLIVAWRTLLVCRLGQECPETDCEAVFFGMEGSMGRHTTTKATQENANAASNGALDCWLGIRWGTKNSEPGPQTVWIGMQLVRPSLGVGSVWSGADKTERMTYGEQQDAAAWAV